MTLLGDPHRPILLNSEVAPGAFNMWRIKLAPLSITGPFNQSSTCLLCCNFNPFLFHFSLSPRFQASRLLYLHFQLLSPLFITTTTTSSPSHDVSAYHSPLQYLPACHLPHPYPLTGGHRRPWRHHTRRALPSTEEKRYGENDFFAFYFIFGVYHLDNAKVPFSRLLIIHLCQTCKSGKVKSRVLLHHFHQSNQCF